MKPRKKKQMKKKKSHIPFRLNLLFLIVFFSFLALIIRLGYIQVIKGDEFAALVRRTETTTTSRSVPRGSIYDSKGKIVVGNEAKLVINYTRELNASAASMAETAKKLTQYIQIDTSELKERDLKDYWFVTNPEQAAKLLTTEEKNKINQENLSTSQTYEMQLAHITPENIAYSDAEKQAIAIFSKMNSAYALSTVSIKNKDVTEKEVAEVSERLSELPGVDVTSDWDRVYPMGDTLRSILGTVTSEKTGLPSNSVNSLRAKGYSLNDRVGVSYLEAQYEEVLRGSKSVIKNTTNSSGEVVNSNEVYPGKPGDNLILTTDMDFQLKLEKLATDTVLAQSDPAADRIYIVVMNPNSGDIIGITGKKRAYDENGNIKGVEDDALGAINGSYGMGSSIKAATVLAGYMDGVISLNDNQILDEPIVFAASNPKSSWFNRSGQMLMDDVEALERSSNVYMIKLAMRMGGQYDYVPGGKLNINDSVFDKLRYYYAQFGLGVRTGIDLPNESTGYNGGTADSFSALDFSFGQFDLYTPLQLAQYMSTIANGGTRIAPRLVKEIHSTSADGGVGALQTVITPKVMNSIQVAPDIITHIKKGLYLVTHGANGTSTAPFAGFSPDVAGKTGSTEAFYDGPIEAYKQAPVVNSTFASYAPYENPEVVVAVVAPYFIEVNPTEYAAGVARKVYDLYYP